ncbi:MAG: hypothetical protein IPG69_04930 [Flavobacteriales bacterium]|nr:hypothetical protein [Flavobacteriales bacterium]
MLTVTDDCGVLTESDAVTIAVPIMQPLAVTVQSDVTVYCPETSVQLFNASARRDPG